MRRRGRAPFLSMDFPKIELRDCPLRYIVTSAPLGEHLRTMADEAGKEETTDTMIRRHSAYGNQPPWSRPKTGRRLTFADEEGEALYEVTYENNTHYSRDTSTKIRASNSGCCVIS